MQLNIIQKSDHAQYHCTYVLKTSIFQLCFCIPLDIQWSIIILMYFGYYIFGIWWFRIQFPFLSVYFARCKLSYISCFLSRAEVISDFLMDFACLMTRKAQLMLTVIVINHSLQLTQHLVSLSVCLPPIRFSRPSVNVIHHMPILASDSKSFQ